MFIRPGTVSALIVAVGLSSAVGGAMSYAALRKDVTIVAGAAAARHTTFKRTVGQVLREAGVTLHDNDETSPPPDARVSEGLHIVVRRAVPVTLLVDGKTVAMESAAPTVEALIQRRRVALFAADKVFPARKAAPVPRMRIRVVRIQHRLVTDHVAVPYQVRSRVDPKTPRGIVRVLSPGRPGLRERAWTVTLADGRVASRELIGQRVVRLPLDRVVAVGSQILLASRGQFAGKEYFDMVATAYSPFCCKGVDNVTAIGLRAGYGVVAVDPRVIPLRSRLYIEGYGYALAGDTGSRIKGLRVDLGFDTRREAIRFGRRPVRVYIIQKHVRR